MPCRAAAVAWPRPSKFSLQSTRLTWNVMARSACPARRSLGEPYTHLVRKVRSCGSSVTPANQGHLSAGPGRRVILLIVFHKIRRAQTAEVAHALEAQKVSEESCRQRMFG